MGCYVFFSLLVLAVLLLKFLNHFRSKGAICIFHPFCSDGGGGERVLWFLIKTISKNFPDRHVYIYCHTGINKNALLKSIKEQFGLTLERTDFELVQLKFCSWLNHMYHPFCTLFTQNIYSIFLAFYGMLLVVPELYIDTTGFAFTYPLFKIFCGSRILAYVHYPALYEEVIEEAFKGRLKRNHEYITSNSKFLPTLKGLYYYFFSFFYFICGLCCDVALTNSSWTHENLKTVWKYRGSMITQIVHPPCGIVDKTDYNIVKDKTIVSLGQFRPEKRHEMQLDIFHQLLGKMKNGIKSQFKLIIIGNSRNKHDEEILNSLKAKAKKLKVASQVKFVVNAPSELVKNYLRTGLFGLHTMENEHFGISIVEMALNGLIVVSHKSGGPLRDIIGEDKKHPRGFLAQDVNEFANTLFQLISLEFSHQDLIRSNCKKFMKDRFSDDAFEVNLTHYLKDLV